MPSIKIKNIIFKPALIPSIVTVALLYLLVSLGLWQLDRAEYKANLQSIIETRLNAAPITLEDVNTKQNKWLYQPVTAYGKYDNTHTLLLDNQVDNMQAGYHVYTPLILNESDAILVNRGWVKQTAQRSMLPVIPVITSSFVFNGFLAPSPSSALVLSQNANDYEKWPAVLQFVDIDEIEKKVGYKLLPMVLVLNNAAQTSFKVQPVNIAMKSSKHQAYAFQWFSLSFALLVIYITVNSKRINT